MLMSLKLLLCFASEGTQKQDAETGSERISKKRVIVYEWP